MGCTMQRETIKESRRVLRRIQDHLYQAHNNLGGTCETVNLVDVLSHPTNPLASLNYITPRRNTAWVSGDMIAHGLEHLQTLKRIARVQYIEGLFPPLFAKTLLDLGLQTEWELPLMVYLKDGFNGQKPAPVQTGTLPDGIRLERVSDQRGAQLWWYVWRNAFYDVVSLGVEPLYAGADLSVLKLGHQLDILLYRNGFPVGVARLSIQEPVAHILGLALMKEARKPALTRLLWTATIEAALAKNCTLIYAPGETEADREMARSLGFLDFGSIVCYTSAIDTAEGDHDDHILGQPVLALR